MRPGDVVLTKKMRCYSGQKIITPGIPEFMEARAEPGEFIALIALGSVPKGARVDGMAGLERLGYVPKEGYPNPSRFNVEAYHEQCLVGAQTILDQAPPCPACETGRPTVEDKDLVVRVRCQGCDSTIELQPYEKFQNSVVFAMEAARAWMAAHKAVAQNQVPDEAESTE